VTRPPFEVADIVRRHGDRVLARHHAWVTGRHRRVLRAIAQCRTAALGGHRDRCDQCAQPVLSYNSCRDRHCPKCLTAARNAWVAAREQELLPVGYVHVVFTMPEPLARLALVNKRVVYDLLFQAAAETHGSSFSKCSWPSSMTLRKSRPRAAIRSRARSDARAPEVSSHSALGQRAHRRGARVERPDDRHHTSLGCSSPQQPGPSRLNGHS